MFKVTDKYSIGADVYSLTILEKRTTGPESKNPGEIVHENIGYYTSFRACFRALSEIVMRDSVQVEKSFIALKEAHKAILIAIDEVQHPDFDKNFVTQCLNAKKGK